MIHRKASYLYRTDRYQWLSEKKARAKQLEKLKKIIEYAYSHSRFYRDTFDRAGVKPSDLKNFDDIRKFPLTSKETIRENLDSVLTVKRNSRRLKFIKTSGSCGDAMEIVYSNRSWDYTSAVYARNLFAMGYKPWQKIAFYWEPDPVFIKHATAFYHKIGIMKKCWIYSTDPPEKQLNLIASLNPPVIIGFPSSLKLLCRLIRENSYKSAITPNMIVSSFEVLSEETRTFIEETFNAPVYNWYTSTEFMGMAGECQKRSGLHINTDSIFVEILKNGANLREGGSGELVVTGLEMEAMPLIRYQLKDYGVLSSERCSCGRNLPLLTSLEGRNDDFILLKNGEFIGPRSIVGLMDKAVLYNGQVKNFRVIQKAESKVVVKVVRDSNFHAGTLTEIRRVLSGLFKNLMDIEIISVEVIEKNRRGKLRFVISELDKNLWRI